MISQALARPTRTAAQLIPAGILVECIDAFIVDLTDRQYAALLGLLTVVLGYIQILIENRTGKAFLRKPPGPAVEVVEESVDNETGPQYT